MSRFSPLSSVAIRVDGSVIARNFTEERYAAPRFLKVSPPHFNSGKAFSVTTPSGDRLSNMNGPDPTGVVARSPAFSVARYFGDMTPKKYRQICSMNA